MGLRSPRSVSRGEATLRGRFVRCTPTSEEEVVELTPKVELLVPAFEYDPPHHPPPPGPLTTTTGFVGRMTFTIRTSELIFPAASRRRNVREEFPRERLGLEIGQIQLPDALTVVWQRSIPPVPPMRTSSRAPVSPDPENTPVVVGRGSGITATIGRAGATVSMMNVPVAVEPELPLLSLAVTTIV